MKSPQGILFSLWIFLLSALSGFVNITTLLLFATPSSHMTGNLSQFLLAVMNGDAKGAFAFLGVLLSFCAGGICSGLLFSNKVFRWANRYGMLLLLFSAGLWISYVGQWSSIWLYELAFTIGTQNGMFIYYKGMIVRTSHYTGYLTDTGFAIGRYLRGHKEDGPKILFYMVSMLCFLIGGVFAYEIAQWSYDILLLAIAISYLIAGLYYFTVRHIRYYELEGENE